MFASSDKWQSSHYFCFVSGVFKQITSTVFNSSYCCCVRQTFSIKNRLLFWTSLLLRVLQTFYYKCPPEKEKSTFFGLQISNMVTCLKCTHSYYWIVFWRILLWLKRHLRSCHLPVTRALRHFCMLVCTLYRNV